MNTSPLPPHHQAIKPSSSRQQSAEIFVLCLKYRAPHAIDPRLLDPGYVFQEVIARCLPFMMMIAADLACCSDEMAWERASV